MCTSNQLQRSDELTNAFSFFVCVHLKEIMCVCIFVFWPSVHFLLSKRSGHTSRSISTFDVTWIQKYISVLMSDSRLTHDRFTIFWKKCKCDWLNRRWTCTRWGWFIHNFQLKSDEYKLIKTCLDSLLAGFKGPLLNKCLYVSVCVLKKQICCLCSWRPHWIPPALNENWSGLITGKPWTQRLYEVTSQPCRTSRSSEVPTFPRWHWCPQHDNSIHRTNQLSGTATILNQKANLIQYLCDVPVKKIQ